MPEYTLLFLLVVVTIAVITLYTQRALQARLYDVQVYMINQAREASGKPVPYQYEPYYGRVKSVVTRVENSKARLESGGTSGIFTKFINESTGVVSESDQLPPAFAH